MVHSRQVAKPESEAKLFRCFPPPPFWKAWLGRTLRWGGQSWDLTSPSSRELSQQPVVLGGGPERRVLAAVSADGNWGVGCLDHSYHPGSPLSFYTLTFSLPLTCEIWLVPEVSCFLVICKKSQKAWMSQLKEWGLIIISLCTFTQWFMKVVSKHFSLPFLLLTTLGLYRETIFSWTNLKFFLFYIGV